MAILKKCGLTLTGLKVTSCFTVVMICLETVLLCTQSTCSKSFYVHWNTTNSIFRIDNTDHIIDVNKGNVKFEYDQVNIICPVYMPGTYDEDAEKYIVYNVSREEYETCRITNPNPRIIAVCDKPYKLMYFTITFRPFTPQPGGLEFTPGEDYYFISTSSKDDLHRRIGGRCSTHNMKIVFKVCCKQKDSALINSTTKASTTSTTALSRPIFPVIDSTTSSSTHIITKQETQPTRKPTKKINEYDKHPNEVVKNEELTYNSGVWLSAASPAFLLLIACVACWRWR